MKSSAVFLLAVAAFATNAVAFSDYSYELDVRGDNDEAALYARDEFGFDLDARESYDDDMEAREWYSTDAELDVRSPEDSEILEARDDVFNLPRELLDEIEMHVRNEVENERRAAEGNVLERRKGGGGGVAGAIKDVVEMGINLVKKLKAMSNQDKANRSGFTQQLVSDFRKKYPGFNVVVCCSKHHHKWAGQQGKDWQHQHQEFDVKLGGTVGYEIYVAKAGEFWRDGDGGYLNWAFAGNVIKRDQGGKHLVFGK